MTKEPPIRRKHSCEDVETNMKQSWVKGRVSRAVTREANLRGALRHLWNNRKRGGGNSGFHKRKDFSENYPQFGQAPSEFSPALS